MDYADLVKQAKERERQEQIRKAAPDLLAALKDLQDELHKHFKMKVRKHYSLMVADSMASNAIAKAEGRL